MGVKLLDGDEREVERLGKLDEDELNNDEDELWGKMDGRFKEVLVLPRRDKEFDFFRTTVVDDDRLGSRMGFEAVTLEGDVAEFDEESLTRGRVCR